MTSLTLIAVEVSVTKDPDGQPAVLLQFEYGYLVLPAASADHLADLLVEMAGEARNRERMQL